MPGTYTVNKEQRNVDRDHTGVQVLLYVTFKLLLNAIRVILRVVVNENQIYGERRPACQVSPSYYILWSLKIIEGQYFLEGLLKDTTLHATI